MENDRESQGTPMPLSPAPASSPRAIFPRPRVFRGAAHRSPPSWPPGLLRRVSWGAIFAGTAVALMVTFALGLLGLAIGLAVLEPGQTGQNPLALGRGTGVWMAGSVLVGLFSGGWIAGRLAGHPFRVTGMIHGVVIWALVVGVYAVLNPGPLRLMTTASLGDGGGDTESEDDNDSSVFPGERGPNKLMARAPGAIVRATPVRESSLPDARVNAISQQSPADTVPAEQILDAMAWRAFLVFMALMAGLVAAGAGGALGVPRRSTGPPESGA